MPDPRRVHVIRQVDPNDPTRVLVVPIQGDPETIDRIRREDPEAASFISEVGPAEQAELAREQDIARRQDIIREMPLWGRLAGFGVSFANEALLGLPAHLAGEAGVRQLEAFSREIPGTVAAARIGANVIPALLTGGSTFGTAQGAGAFARFLPSGFAQAAGNSVVESLTARLMAGGLSERVARGIALAAGAATDGGISGVQAAITESNITGSQLDAEQWLAGGLFGAGLGLGVGGLLGPMSMAGRRAGTPQGRLAQEQAQQLAESGATPASVQVLPDGRLQLIPGANQVDRGPVGNFFTNPVARFVSGTNPSDETAVRMLSVPGNMARATDNTGYIANVQRQSTEFNAGLNRARNEALGVLRAAGERQGILRALDDSGIDIGPVRGQLQAQAALIRNAVSNAGERLESGAVTRAGELASLMERAASAETASEFGIRLDNFLDRVRSNRLDEGYNDATLQSAIRTASSGAESVMRGLGPEGEAVAAAHSVLRQYDLAVRDLRGRALQHNVSFDEERLDPGRLFSSTSDSGFRVKLDMTDDFVNVLSQAHRAVELAEEAYGVTSPGLRESLQESVRGLGDSKQWGQLIAAYRDLSSKESRASGLLAAMGAGTPAVAGLVGGVLGGPVGAVAGAAAGATFAIASHPMSSLQRLGFLSGATRATRTRMADSLNGLQKSLTSSARFRSIEQGGRQLPRIVMSLQNRESRRQEYQEVTAQLQQLASNPDMLMDTLAGATEGVSELSPQMATHLSIAYMRGVAYLVANLPPADAPSPFGHLVDLEPSQSEMASFLRRFEAIEDPISIIDKAANFSLTAEHVAAVQAVYPELYTHIQSEIAGIIGDLEHLPPYSARMSLGTLLGIPADPSLDAQFIARMQQRYAQTQLQQQEIGPQQSSGAQRTSSGATRAGSHTYSESQSIYARLDQGAR